MVLVPALMLMTTFVFAGEGGEGNGGNSNYVKLEPFVVNLKGSNYVSFTPELKLSDPADGALLKAYTPVVRFALIKSMMGQDAAQVQTPAFMKSFAEAAVDLLNKALGGQYVKGVFFSDWIVQ
jgi:flagellar basal body-associated protein FliL